MANREELVEKMLIPLTRGQAAIVDASDYEALSKFKWYAKYARHTDSFYAARADKRIELRMHRVIMGLLPKDPLEIDHINHDTLDNRRINLRIVTGSLNQANRKKMCHNTTGYPGVHWNRDNGRYQAKIKINHKTIHLGYFDDPAEGSKVYEARRQERLSGGAL